MSPAFFVSYATLRTSSCAPASNSTARMKKAAGKAPAKAVKLTEKDEERLHAAISAGHLQNVSRCLARGFEPSWSLDMLKLALNRRYEKIFTMLVEHGARVQDVAAFAIENALDSQWRYSVGTNPELWKVELILMYLTRDTVRSSFLRHALPHAPTVAALLRLGADPNWEYDRNLSGGQHVESILAYAIENGHCESAIILLEGGADARWQTSCRSSWQYHANPSRKKATTETLLHRVVQNPRMSADVMRLLLAKGADPSVSEDFSPLKFAIMERRYQLVECLLEYGASSEGMIDYAFSYSRWDAIPILVQHAAVPKRLLLGWGNIPPPLPIVGTLLRIGGRFDDAELMRWMAAGGVRVSNPQEARAAARLLAPQLLQKIP